MKARVSVLLVASALALGAALPPRSARAAPTSVRDGLAADARAKFDEGSRLYKAARYAEAREAFLAAHAQSGDARILFNVAVCDKALGRYARALATLQKSLASPDRPLPAEYTQRASEAIATLSRYVAFATLEPSAEGASLAVDGEPVRDNPVALETGEHTVTASKDGYEPLSVVITVKAGDTPRVKLSLVSASRPGTARITCSGAPPCEIRVGDRALGAAPVSFSAGAGTYVVVATVEGKPFTEQTIELVNGKTIEVSLAPRPVRPAHLRVSTDRPDDLVSVDGRNVGQSGIEVELAPGEHRVAITRRDGGSKSLDLLLRENETRDLRVTLDEKKGPSAWWFVGGGVVLAGVATTAYLLSTSRSTRYEGSSAGTLNPYVVPAAVPAAHGGSR